MIWNISVYIYIHIYFYKLPIAYWPIGLLPAAQSGWKVHSKGPWGKDCRTCQQQDGHFRETLMEGIGATCTRTHGGLGDSSWIQKHSKKKPKSNKLNSESIKDNFTAQIEIMSGACSAKMHVVVGAGTRTSYMYTGLHVYDVYVSRSTMCTQYRR